MALALSALVIVGAFAVYCLTDLARAQVRSLPKWAWALIICLVMPWGGIVYLVMGRQPGPARLPVPAPGTLPAAVTPVAPSLTTPARPTARRPPSGPVTVEVDRLVKRFGPVTAVDGLSFTVRPGTVTGFLGPNGAWKSTTLRVLLGLNAPTSGTALIGGRRYQDRTWPLHEVGALLDATALPPGRSARDYLLALAQSNGIGRNGIGPNATGQRRVTEVLELTGLAAVAGRRTGQFSLGMKQRLGLAAALLADPPVLLLDEPVNGLDPEGIRWIRQLLRSMAAEGRTILISSHLMSEMALTADHLVIIGRGRLLADTPTARFTAAARRDVLVRSPRSGELAGLLAAAGAGVSAEDGGLAVTGVDAAAVGELAAAHGIALHELTARQASLEDAYLAVTGESAEDPVGQQQPGTGGRVMTTNQDLAGSRDRSGGPAAPGRVAVASGVIASEWTKLRSLRSNRWTLGIAAVVTLGLTVVVALGFSSGPASGPGAGPVDDLTSSFLAYAEYAVLPVVVLSVLAFTSEYSSGLIRTTFAAVPGRRTVLAAKAVVTGAAALVTGELLAFACFFLAQAILSGHQRGLSLAHPGAVRAVLAAGLVLPACALVGLGAGAVLRHTAGAIAAAVTAVFLLAALCLALPAPWNLRAGRFTLLFAAYQEVTLHPRQSLLSPGLSLLVIVAWPAVALLVAAAVLARRDV